MKVPIYYTSEKNWWGKTTYSVWACDPFNGYGVQRQLSKKEARAKLIEFLKRVDALRQAMEVVEI